MSKGFIYILTNPSFPQYVKIGYATDVKQRLDELNRSTAVPFAFRVYATYEVDSALSDKKLHSILDKLDPELRSTEEVDGKRRIREFYAMTPEDAYSILEAIAEINDYRHRLKKWKATATEQREEALALSKVLKEMTLVVSAKGGGAGRLFGSVTNAEIADALAKNSGIKLDKRKIVISDPIKSVGTYTVTCKLGYEITAALSVKIEEI